MAAYGGTSWERIGFVFGCVALAYFAGYFTRAFSWPPHTHLNRALQQAYGVVTPPIYLSEKIYDRSGATVLDPQWIEPGLTLVSSHLKHVGGDPVVRLLDHEGRVRHEWRVKTDELFPEDQGPGGALLDLRNRSSQGLHLLPNGDLLVSVFYRGLARLDACGRVLWSLAEPTHHSISRSEDGTFWVPSTSLKVTTEGLPTSRGTPLFDRPVFHDHLIEITGDGTVERRLSVLEIFASNGLADMLYRLASRNDPDVTHLNDIEPLSSEMAEDYPLFEAGDLLVSMRNVNLVFVVDPDSREVKWTASAPFIRQHDPDFVGDGWIGVFDNRDDGTIRGERLGGSRIVALRPGSDSVEIWYPTDRSDPFYTLNMGNWQLLPGGNMLLTESRAGRVLETSPEGETVWEWIVAPHSESLVPEVPTAIRYDLTPEEVAAWPCSPGATSGS